MTTNGQDSLLTLSLNSGSLVVVEGVRGRVTALSNKEVSVLDASGHLWIIDRGSITVVGETA